MDFSVLVQKFQVGRTIPKIRGVTAILASIIIIGVEYSLVNRPIPVNVDSNKYPAKVRFNQEELTIEELILDPDRVLFSMDGRINEFVDIHFDEARLSEKSIKGFEGRPNSPPVGLAMINYITEKPNLPMTDPGKKPESVVEGTKNDESGTCLIFVKAEAAPGSQLKVTTHFFQRSVSTSTRDFDMTANVDLVVSMKTSPPISNDGSNNDSRPGCGKLLQVDTWRRHYVGFWETEVIAPANSTIHFRIVSHKPNSLWTGPKDLFQPFVFGPRPLQASAIIVNSLKGGKSSTPEAPPALEARAANGQLLNISNFLVAAEEIQLDFSGKAWVRTHGDYVTGNFFEHLEKYPVISNFLSMANGAFLLWVISIFKGILAARPNRNPN